MAEDGGSRRDMEAGESTNSTSAASTADDVVATTTLGSHQWPTVDGPLGVYHEEAVKLAKRFYYAGFLLLPWLWFINCFYFWPVLQNPRSDPLIRPYVVKSGIGFLVYGSLLLAWALTFAYGGEELFGASWRSLAVYDIAEKYAQWALKHALCVCLFTCGSFIGFQYINGNLRSVMGVKAPSAIGPLQFLLFGFGTYEQCTHSWEKGPLQFRLPLGTLL